MALDTPFNAEITSKNVKVKYNIRIAQQQREGKYVEDKELQVNIQHKSSI